MTHEADLALIRAFGEALTRRQLAVLSRMAEHEDDDDGELVREGHVAFIGIEGVPDAVVDALLLACAISDTGYEGGIERYVINSTGHEILARHAASSH